MKLYDIMKDVKQIFHIDETLRVYIYKDRIDFIDFTSKILDKDGNELVPDFYGKLFSVEYKDKIITIVEPQSLSFMTANNVSLYRYLCSLVHKEIEDLDSFPVIPEYEHEDLAQTL